ncbi:class I SAM-dependent methyltransferase [Alistipes sp. OttesenSCG-928-B03]|nr:class I SAM-dependent methyltransferase [Alistipes sp. OttesenSCG-928-B03]
MNDMHLLTPTGWEDYELIDSGGFEKLERFGRWITVRPEPQAIWRRSLPDAEWERLATAVFRRDDNQRGGSPDGGERGRWLLRPGMPEQWWVEYAYKEMKLRMRLGLTSFKHVGIFPEQAANWDFIYDRTREIGARNGTPARVLNLFAYTGGATLAGLAGGGEVTHVDSVKQVVTWSRENMERSGLDGARWIVDDALKFVRREARRGRVYDGIILDPPAYGRGPDGEKWVLEQHIGELLENCAQLLAPRNSFLVFNLYSMGLSALLAKTAANQLFGTSAPDFAEQSGELYFADRAGKSLPLGVYYRFSR